MTDAPKIAKKREREKLTVSRMVAIYCRKKHPGQQDQAAYCGENVCPECAAVDAYAVLRTERCRRMGEKASCKTCPNHCYQPGEREKIREVMRFAGPRMVTVHPVDAFRHLAGEIGKSK